jgi:hypothetical protein
MYWVLRAAAAIVITMTEAARKNGERIMAVQPLEGGIGVFFSVQGDSDSEGTSRSRAGRDSDTVMHYTH